MPDPIPLRWCGECKSFAHLLNHHCEFMHARRAQITLIGADKPARVAAQARTQAESVR